MTSHAFIEPAAEPASRFVVYEQPLNERMRTFLRLEFLYSQALYHTELPNPWSSRAAVGSLLEILTITARGDVRSDVIKELERHVQALNEFQSKPGVDAGRLRSVMSNLIRLRSELVSMGANFMQPLRESEFLNAIKHRSAIPGGTCEFDLPDYSFWLSRPAESRMATFEEWMKLVRPLCDGVIEILWVTRQNARPREEVAAGGQYQINFERENPIQLLRIILPTDSDLYPEISGSHYRCSLRFMSWKELGGRAVQTEEDVRFVLTSCT
ncbi:MAG TPA: cell division protein ZapD [Steroidobacteraceae bacterium]|jgi:cell division protein ZapD|nr:cell division protein ZapD [Steroidobacteraceae bacterium]